jgi:hypothetical protein
VAGAATYTLQYATSSDFLTGLVTVADLAGLTHTPTALADGVWYWRVLAKDLAGNMSAYSGSWSLTIDTQAPGAPTNFTVLPGHNKVHLSWTNAGSDFDHTVIMRSDWYAGGSGYPRYDNAHTEGPYPNDTSLTFDLVYSGVGTGVIDDYQITSDTRDVYHYTAFTVDAAGNISSAGSSPQGRATSYWLGDKTRDGAVYFADLTYLSNTYWTSFGAPEYDPEFDIGPTTDYSPKGIPVTDDVINFEDLVIFALNFGTVGPAGKTVPLFANQGTAGELGLSLTASNEINAVGDEFTVRVDLVNNPGTTKAVRCVVDYDRTALKFITADRGPELKNAENVFFDGRDREDGIDLSVALLGGSRTISGSGTLAILRFRVIGSGTPSIDLGITDARDAENRSLAIVKSNGPGMTLPESYRLAQNYPNPFNPSTTILYDIPKSGTVSICIYNVQGQVVRTLLDGDKPAGSYRIVWDGRSDQGTFVATGVYFYRIVAGDFTSTRKMLMLK